MEFIEGQSLDKLLSLRQRRLSISQVVNYATQLARVLSRLHAAGWVWRDCKPSNLIVSQTRLRPIDFEGACRINQHHPLPVGTREFLPANDEEHFALPARPAADLYAMGVVIYYLLAGVLPSSANPIPIQKLRKSVPTTLLRVLSALMHPEPEARTPARIVAKELTALAKQPG
jgi:serine/threonine-protein kinase